MSAPEQHERLRRETPAAGPRRPTAVGRRFLRLVERHATVARRYWWYQAAVLLEPFVYLAAVGLGISGLVGTIEVGGRQLDYKTFVAPGLLVGAAMNEAVLEASIGFFVRFKYWRVYDAVLASPLTLADVAKADIAWSVAQTLVGGVSFLLAMVLLGLMPSWWGLLALPVVALVAFAFSAIGLAGATFMRTYVDFEMAFVSANALFLFSGVFFPVDQYPDAVRVIVEWTPLYQAVELARGLALGPPTVGMVFNVAYLLVVAWLGTVLARRRLERLLRS